MVCQQNGGLYLLNFTADKVVNTGECIYPILRVTNLSTKRMVCQTNKRFVNKTDVSAAQRGMYCPNDTHLKIDSKKIVNNNNVL